MSKWARILIVMTLACAAGLVLVVRNKESKPCTACEGCGDAPAAVTNMVQVAGSGAAVERLPLLVDLGANKCVSCKMMTPVLEELGREFSGKFDVKFIDVWENENAGEEYGIRIIPTQIFFDGAGKELFRHEGFFGKDQILAKWREFGVLPGVEPSE